MLYSSTGIGQELHKVHAIYRLLVCISAIIPRALKTSFPLLMLHAQNELESLFAPMWWSLFKGFQFLGGKESLREMVYPVCTTSQRDPVGCFVFQGETEW